MRLVDCVYGINPKQLDRFREATPMTSGVAPAALRTVADRLLSVACTLLEQQTLFDPAYEVRDAAGA